MEKMACREHSFILKEREQERERKREGRCVKGNSEGEIKCRIER